MRKWNNNPSVPEEWRFNPYRTLLATRQREGLPRLQEAEAKLEHEQLVLAQNIYLPLIAIELYEHAPFNKDECDIILAYAQATPEVFEDYKFQQGKPQDFRDELSLRAVKPIANSIIKSHIWWNERLEVPMPALKRPRI